MENISRQSDFTFICFYPLKHCYSQNRHESSLITGKGANEIPCTVSLVPSTMYKMKVYLNFWGFFYRIDDDAAFHNIHSIGRQLFAYL